MTVTTPPAVEPITLEQAKNYLRVTTDADDAEIAALIATVRRYAEHWLRRAFITQKLEIALGGFPAGAGSVNGFLRAELHYGAAAWGGDWMPRSAADPIEIQRAPLQSIDSVRYIDQAGAEILMDPAAYQVSKSDPARLAPAPYTVWPATQPGRLEAVTIAITAGYGDDAATVPPTIVQALKLWLAHLYENRGENPAEPPPAAAALLYSEDFGSYG